MRKIEQNNEKALDAFMGAVAAVKEKLAVLDTYMDDHMGLSPEAVSWPDANSAIHVEDMLDNIIAFCNIPEAKEGNA